MPNVSFQIGARSYTLRCAAGQEDHLRQMAAALDRRIQPLLAATPGADDRQLLVIAAIAMLDELAATGETKSIVPANDRITEDSEIQAANQRLLAENAALQEDVAALRAWADSMAGRLTALSQSLGALAQVRSDD